jgi:polysaccharide biosynthesis/export protein
MSLLRRFGVLASLGALALGLSLLVGCASGLPFQSRVSSGKASADQAPPTEMITEQLILVEKQQTAQQRQQDISSLINKSPPPYTIGPGDVLSIVVWDHPELAGAGMPAAAATADAGALATVAANATPAGFVVDHKGRIQFPFAGLLPVEGMTEEQARTLLSEKLAKYIASPNVTLRVQSYRSKRVYIDGEVKSPGLQAINDIPMSLTEALNRAGGLLPTADQSRIAIERDKTRYDINLRELVQKGVDPNTIMLAPGDLVRVHSRDESKVFVSGEVITPRALTMHDGKLTLNEALGESGGVSPLSGDARQIYVVRKGADGKTRVFQLDARETGSIAMAEEFELRPKDVVYVAASPLANWNRNLSLLFPGALTSAVGVTTRP